LKRKININFYTGFLLLILLSVLYSYYLFSKGPVDISHSSAIKIYATDLYGEFISNPSAAVKFYSGKILQVSGNVASVSINLQNKKIILLKTSIGGAFINCTMEEDPGEVKINSIVNIKGICSGIGQGDEDLEIKGDVYFTRGFLIK
jgi:hypothetical protein